MNKHVQAWKYIESNLAKVPDPLLRNSMRAELEKRALTEWGFCPTKEDCLENKPEIQFTGWRKEFLDAVRLAQKFKFKRSQESKDKLLLETCYNMAEFVNDGNTLEDMPKDLQESEFIRKLYLLAKEKYDKKTCLQDK